MAPPGCPGYQPWSGRPGYQAVVDCSAKKPRENAKTVPVSVFKTKCVSRLNAVSVKRQLGKVSTLITVCLYLVAEYLRGYGMSTPTGNGRMLYSGQNKTQTAGQAQVVQKIMMDNAIHRARVVQKVDNAGCV